MNKLTLTLQTTDKHQYYDYDNFTYVLVIIILNTYITYLLLIAHTTYYSMPLNRFNISLLQYTGTS